MRDNTVKMFEKEINRLDKKIERLQGELECGKRCGDSLNNARNDLEDVRRVFVSVTKENNELEDKRTINRHMIMLVERDRIEELKEYVKRIKGIA